MLLSKNKHDTLHDHTVTRSFPSSWHTTCTSLECVSLLDVTWVHNHKYGWVTLDDLEQILLRREKLLLNREQEFRKREEVLRVEQRVLEERECKLKEQISGLGVWLSLEQSNL